LTLVGSGNNIINNPTINTTYYVRGEGTCNTTNCISAKVTINTSSASATSATGTPSVICSGLSSTLQLSGGSLGIGSVWKWYSGTCGGQYEGNDTTIMVSPTVTTIYYVRAENVCNTTGCVSKEIEVNTNSIAPLSATSNPGIICEGQLTTLGITGGILGTSADWFWYIGTCSGTVIGNGPTQSLSPTATATYYVRGEGLCNTTICISVGVVVQTGSTAATTIITTVDTICESMSTTLGFTGGHLGTSADWQWYRGSCGGTSAGNGLVITVSPTVTTAYFVRAEGICNTTLCINKTVIVNDSSITAGILTASLDTVCSGLPTTLSLSGGTLGTLGGWHWYKGTCGGVSAGNGSTVIVSPALTSVYYVRAEGVCNTTPCINISVIVNDSSVTANSATAVMTTICEGNTTTLGLSGGTLGTNAGWYWYSGSCGGNGLGIGSTIVDNPQVSTTYYIRAEGLCNTTPCKSIEITVNTNSTGIITGVSSPDTICDGTSTNLIITGGQLGTGGDWYWYSGGCGQTVEGVGTIITVSPTATINYYVRAEGICNTTGCITVPVYVKTNSINVITVTGTLTTICEGGTTTLGITGGMLGTGAGWYWYSGSCGGTIEGNGTGIIVSPTVTTDYYVRGEGYCNTTQCGIITITVNDSSITATTVTATPDTLCYGFSTTLAVTGGLLGTGGNWHWYLGSCGGMHEEMGSPITVIPTITVDYYVRAEGICNTTSCIQVHVTVKTNSTPVSSVTSTSTTICEGGSTNLGISGGALGTSANWYWYSMTCGGINEGNGTGITVTPTVTTNYYVRGEGVCNTTTCGSIIITVNDSSVTAGTITTQHDTICYGLSTTLGFTGGITGTGATWHWYSGTCGGIVEGIGTTITVSPTTTTEYYLRAEGLCNTTGCIHRQIEVNTISLNTGILTTTQSTLCYGSSTTLEINGGILGTGADWYWYGVICGGTLLGNGSTQIVTPPSTCQYYVRAEGTCNTTICKSITINILLLPTPPDTIISNNNGFCSDAGGSINLAINGGNGDIFMWYTGGCYSTQIGSGISLTLPSPAVSTVYYGNWQTISCGNSTCTSIEITVIPKPSDPQTASAVPDTVGTGQSTVLQVTGTLSGGELWSWYENSCGLGTSLGTGSSLEIYPQSSTIYYVRAENGVCYSNCVTATLTIPGSMNNAGSITTSPSDTICLGNTVTLGVTNTLNGGDWYWYENVCGGTFLGTGITMQVQPTGTTTYSVRQELGGLLSSCEIKVVYVNTLSSPGTLSSTTDTICEGQPAVLTIGGGTLGTGGSWNWYSGTCGGASEGNGTSITVNPTVTTDYYVRAEGECNTTQCLNKTITVNYSSIPAGSITVLPGSVICTGTTVTLGVSGGSLGTTADWYWYDGTCAGTSIGNGTSIIINPSVTTDYYVRAEGICNITTCVNIHITVNDISNAATTITALPDTLCTGASTQISISGGFLGTQADWYWYSGSCTGTSEGQGVTLISSPTVTTDYYVRAEGICNTTTCINVTVTVNTNSISATSISATPDTIIKGNGATLNIVGGFTGTGATWNWYEGSCSGNIAGQGSTITVYPTVTSTYFVKGEGICNTTNCADITVTVNDSSLAAASVTSGADTICSGATVTLGLTGGTLGTNASWIWYSGGCGTNPVGNGASLTVMPTVTTDYFVRAEGLLNTTTCAAKQIVVNTLTVLPTSIIANMDTINIGVFDTIRIIDGTTGTGGNWYWYSGGCGGTFLGNGTMIGISPTLTTVYYLRGIGICDSSACISKEIYVIPGYTVSGTLMYDQSSNPLDSVWLYLNSNGNKLDSARTDTLGFYHFSAVQSGVYTVTGKTHKPWGGVNSTDAVKVKRHFAGSELFTTSLRIHAGDVNSSFGINTTDAVKITRRFVGSDTLFTRGDWNFEKPFGGDTINVSPNLNDTIVVNGSNLVQDFKGICIGDVNGSNVPFPGAKTQSKVQLNYNEVKRLGSGQYFEMPVKVTNDLGLGALSLILNYPKELVEVKDVKLKVNNASEDLYYNVKGNELRIGWFETRGALSLQNGESLIILTLRTRDNFGDGDRIRIQVENNSLCELADENGKPMENIVLNTCSIEHNNTLSIGSAEDNRDNELTIYPNPAKDKMNIDYNLSKDGRVRIELYNLLGEKIEEIVDLTVLKGKYTKEIDVTSLPSGVYTCKMLSENNILIVKRLVISR